MRAPKTLRWCVATSTSLVFAVGVTIAQAPKPKRINQCDRAARRRDSPSTTPDRTHGTVGQVTSLG